MLAIINKFARKKLRKSSKLFSFYQFLVNYKAFNYLLDLLYPRRKRKIKIERNTLSNGSEFFPKSIEGTVRISYTNVKSDDNSDKNKVCDSLQHRHIWVNDQNYDGMEDNDIRGFLDGRYKNAWNQPGQVHVRLGRHRYSHKHGEGELFRILQRWDDVHLPKSAKILDARLVLEVEIGFEHNLEILLYKVNKKWDPGKGGVNRNNNSAPAYGEVWWNEVGYNKEPWGLPGVGFESNSHPDADTPVMPLAKAHYKPGDSSIVFESNKLALYIKRQSQSDKPLLFLLKLSDYLEDHSDTIINFYSGNHGDSRNTARRPRLIVDWEFSNASTEIAEDILLEYDRTLILPRIGTDNMSGLAISYQPKNGSEHPTISIRGGTNSYKSDWQSIYFPQNIENWSWMEVKIDAHVNPICIGQNFTAKLKDTWVITAPPEEQKVCWTFESPSNKEYKVMADYVGDWCWQIKFKPAELGRWQYYWTQDFTEKTYKSPKGIFDVIPGTSKNALQALEDLVNSIRSSDLPKGIERMYAFAPAFYRLQRKLMQFETPESFKESPNGNPDKHFRELLDEARKALVESPWLNNDTNSQD